LGRTAKDFSAKWSPILVLALSYGKKTSLRSPPLPSAAGRAVALLAEQPALQPLTTTCLTALLCSVSEKLSAL